MNIINHFIKIILICFLTTLASCATPRNNLTKTNNNNRISEELKTPLIIEEYKICAKNIAKPDRSEFRSRIEPSILFKRKKWREAYSIFNEIIKINSDISALGYKFIYNEGREEGKKGFRPATSIYYHDNLILQIDFPIRFMINDNKDKFVFVAHDPDRIKLFYFNKNSYDLTKWRSSSIIESPIFIENSLISLEKIIKENNNIQYLVKKDTEVVYSFNFTPEPVRPAIRSFFSIKNKWVLEYLHNIIIDGVNIREKNNYSETFFPYIIDNKLLYCFKKNDKYYVSFNNEVLPYEYDEIIHYECCEPASFNIMGIGNIIWFYALKDDYWYYVEVGIYD